MKKLFHTLIAALAISASSGAFAEGTIYDGCDQAVKNSKATWYVPSYRANAPVVGNDEEIRPLEAPMCVHMDVVGGWAVVPLKTGSRVVFKKGTNQPVRHADCNNPIAGGMYVGNLPGVVPPPVTATVQAPAVSVAVTGTGVGNTFESRKGGDRECIVLFNGRLIASTFVWGSDPAKTKAVCDIFAAGKLAEHTANTP